MGGGKVCERRQPANKEPPPQQNLKKEKNKVNVRKVPLGRSTAQASVPRQGEELGVKRRMRWRVTR